MRGYKNDKYKKKSEDIPQRTCSDMNQIFEVLNQKRWNNRMVRGDDYSVAGYGFIIGTDISLPSVIGINKKLELQLDETNQPKFVDYTNQGQLLVHLATDIYGHPKVLGVQLSEPGRIAVAEDPMAFVGTENISGMALTNDTIALNPMQSLQFHGVSTSYQAVKDGIYNFRGEIGRVNLTPAISENISAKRWTEGGIMAGISPIELSMLMQKESELAIMMRENQMGFTNSEVGKAIINQYLEKQITAYEEAYLEKYPLEDSKPNLSNEAFVDERTGSFQSVISSARFVHLDNKNKSELHLAYAQYQISSLGAAINSKTLSAEQVAMAEEQLKYFENYSHYADLSAKWEDVIINPIKNASEEAINAEDKRDTIAYFSVQNGFSEKNFNQLSQAFAARVKMYRSEISATDNLGNANINKERETLYLQQIEYLGDLIRCHPENPLNKPISPLNSSVDANIQRVDASIEARMNEFNHSLAVMENPDLEISREMLARRDLCESELNKLKDMEKTNSAEEQASIQIAREIIEDTIRSNSYNVSGETYREFTIRQNEQKILSAIANTHGNGPTPFTYKELLDVAASDNPNDLRNFLTIKLNLDYSSADMDKFFSSTELQTAITHPEAIKDYLQSPSSSPLVRHNIADFSDPVICQKMKQELILAIDNARKGHEHVGTLVHDMGILDKHIIENRMELNENQRLLNNYEFDNPYALNPTKEQIKQLEKFKDIDTSNPEKFKDPGFVYKNLYAISKDIESQVNVKYEEQLINIQNDKDLSKEDKASQEKQLNEARVQELNDRLEADVRISVLKDMLKEDSEALKYKDTDMPKGVIDRLELRNEIIEYGCTEKAKETTMEKLTEKFGDRPHFNEVIAEADIQEAARIGYYRNLEKSPLSIQDTMDRIKVYNGFIENGKVYEAPDKYKNIAEELRQNPQFMAMITDKNAELEKIPESIVPGKDVDITNPKECYAYAELLRTSESQQAQRFGEELKQTMSHMEPDLKLRVIYENCQEALQQKDLSMSEIEALKIEAQRQSIECVMKKVENESLASGEVNDYILTNIQNIRGGSSAISAQRDESKLGQLFNHDVISANREEFVTAQEAKLIDSVHRLEDSYQKLYENSHIVGESSTMIMKDGELEAVRCASISQVVARAEVLQSVESQEAIAKTMIDIDQQIHNNRFYEEHIAPIREQAEQIKALEDRIENINNPKDKVSTEVLQTWVDDHPVDRFTKPSIKALYQSYKDTIDMRETSVQVLKEQIADLEAAKPFNYSKDSENLAHNLREYADTVLQPKISEMDSAIRAFSTDGIPDSTISRQEFIINRLQMLSEAGVNSEVVNKAIDIAGFPNNENAIRTAMQSSETIQKVDAEVIDAIHLIDESRMLYVKFQDSKSFDAFKTELASYQSDLRALEECSSLLSAKAALEDYREYSRPLTMIEATSCIKENFGTIDTDIPRIKIGEDVSLNKNAFAEDIKHTLVSGDSMIKYLEENSKFFERADRALAEGPVSADVEHSLCTKLSAYYQYQHLLDSKEAEAIQNPRNILLEDDKIPASHVISSEDLIPAALPSIELPENIQKFYEEHITEVAEEAKYSTFTSYEKDDMEGPKGASTPVEIEDEEGEAVKGHMSHDIDDDLSAY